MKSKISILIFFGIFLCILFRFQIGDFLLSTFGKQSYGTVLSDVRSVKYVKPTFLYQFEIGEASYTGNSMLTDSLNIGKKICIIYLPIAPSVNRPALFLKKVCNNNKAP